MKEMIKVKQLCRKILLPVLIVGLLALCGYQLWYYNLPKFQDVTVELGTETVRLGDFATQYAKTGKLGFVSDPGKVDLSRVGSEEIVLSHGSKQETVTLTVADTVAPEVTFVEKLTRRIDESLPEAKDFITDISDESETKVCFASDVVIPKDYSDITVTVVVEDAVGNTTQGSCVLTFSWMQESFALEYGHTLAKEDLLLDPDRDASLILQEEIDAVNAGAVGEYIVTGRVGQQTVDCHITVADTQGPELTLKNVRIPVRGWVNLNSFVESATDISGVADIRLMSEPDVITPGKQTVLVEAEDIYGNITTQEAILWVANEYVPPHISGANSTLVLEKHSEVDLLEGVSAYDQQDGDCEVYCDTGSLDFHKAGTYYIIYSAVDNSGNEARMWRKVIVNHDQEDTDALVASIAEKLSDDPEAIRDYVRRSISYNHDWGGEDPVWYGFTNRVGNCYVHAMCLKAIFDLKGIESQLIWVTNKTHYWLIVNIDGTWKHIDATPGRTHSRYSLMNDAQRLETLSGRTWDTTQWPACE